MSVPQGATGVIQNMRLVDRIYIAFGSRARVPKSTITPWGRWMRCRLHNNVVEFGGTDERERRVLSTGWQEAEAHF